MLVLAQYLAAASMLDAVPGIFCCIIFIVFSVSRAASDMDRAVFSMLVTVV